MFVNDGAGTPVQDCVSQSRVVGGIRGNVGPGRRDGGRHGPSPRRGRAPQSRQPPRDRGALRRVRMRSYGCLCRRRNGGRQVPGRPSPSEGGLGSRGRLRRDDFAHDAAPNSLADGLVTCTRPHRPDDSTRAGQAHYPRRGPVETLQGRSTPPRRFELKLRHGSMTASWRATILPLQRTM